MVTKMAISRSLLILTIVSFSALERIQAAQADAQVDAPVATQGNVKESEKNSTEPSRSAKDKKQSDVDNKATKDKTFVPSEEISEDFAVSFPADI